MLGFQHQDPRQSLAQQIGISGDSSSTNANVQGLTFGIHFHLEVKTYWNTTGSHPFLLKELWWGQQESIFQCLNYLGKEIQSKYLFLSPWFDTLPFHFFFSSGQALGSFVTQKKKGSLEDHHNPYSCLSSAPYVISSADGFRAHCKQHCNGW